jgi:hypothetical protein
MPKNFANFANIPSMKMDAFQVRRLQKLIGEKKFASDCSELPLTERLYFGVKPLIYLVG